MSKEQVLPILAGQTHAGLVQQALVTIAIVTTAADSRAGLPPVARGRLGGRAGCRAGRGRGCRIDIGWAKRKQAAVGPPATTVCRTADRVEEKAAGQALGHVHAKQKGRVKPAPARGALIGTEECTARHVTTPRQAHRARLIKYAAIRARARGLADHIYALGWATAAAVLIPGARSVRLQAVAPITHGAARKVICTCECIGAGGRLCRVHSGGRRLGGHLRSGSGGPRAWQSQAAWRRGHAVRCPTAPALWAILAAEVEAAQIKHLVFGHADKPGGVDTAAVCRTRFHRDKL